MSDPTPTGANATDPLFSEMAEDGEMADLVAFFVGELKHRIDALDRALQSKDVEELKTLAHQLKGAAGGYGFPTISETAGQLEQMLDDDATKGVERLAADVEALINICRRASV